MWVSRKEFKEMKNEIKLLNERIFDSKLEMDNIGVYLNYVSNKMCDVNTNSIKNVTLQELAQYVLDKKPIVREETKTITKIYN